MIQFTVPGTPVPKGRPRSFVRGGKVGHYTPKKTADYEKAVRMLAQAAMGCRKPINGAVAVEITLFLTPPKSWSIKKRNAAMSGEIFPTATPDIDNCTKAIFDAMNDVVFDDDKQVVDLVVSKRYSEKSFSTVEVKRL